MTDKSENSTSTPTLFRLVLGRTDHDGDTVIEDQYFLITVDDGELMDTRVARQRLDKFAASLPKGLFLDITEVPLIVSRGEPTLTIACTNQACDDPVPKSPIDRFCRRCGKSIKISLTPSTTLAE